MKLGLGTVQFGLEYGIKGDAKPSADEVKAILARAADAGVTVLDTAPAYGNSEEIIGATAPERNPFRIVTKTAASLSATDGNVADAINAALEESLRRLRQSSIHGLLLHHGETLLEAGGDRIWKAMEGARDRGLVRKIGVSVYAAETVDRIIRRFEPEIVQAPLNVFDQGLINRGVLERLRRSGVEFHARSVFLQGLLLMPVDRIPQCFDRFRAPIDRYRKKVTAAGLTPLAAALGFVTAVPGVDTMIVGINSLSQFEEILETIADGARADGFDEFAIDDERLINPSRWPNA